MNSKERWLAVIERKNVDHVPCDIWATDEVFEMLCRNLACDNRWQVFDKLQIDAPYEVKLRYIGPKLADGYDMWGVKYKRVKYKEGVYNEPDFRPLAEAKTLEDIENYQWPSADWFDYSDVKSQIEDHRNRPIRAVVIEPFNWYCRIRGMEQAMIDMIASPDMIEYAFDKMFELATKQFERVLQVADGCIDITVPAEDVGSQTGPLFSVEYFRRFHKPRFRKYINLARQAGVHVFYHTDGAARSFIPDLIELGIDVLNPIQWKCKGMDRGDLKKDFGKQLVFHGGVDNQDILPCGTPLDVRKEVITCFETLGIGGGYICAPCHNIQPNTPIDNIFEMYETIKEVSSDSKYTRMVE